MRRLLSESAFGEIYDEDLSGVHQRGNVDGAFRLPEQIANEGIAEERPDLVLNRRDGFIAEARLVFGELHFPEGAHDVVGAMDEKPCSVIGIDEESRESE